MKNIQQAAFGTWKSPFTPEFITAGVKSFSDVKIDGEDVYWSESRPEEFGRNVIVKSSADGVSDITPAITDENYYNVRSKVHEYGGSSFVVHDGITYFVNCNDQRIYIQDAEGIKALTEPGIRYADLHYTKHGLLAIAEQHIRLSSDKSKVDNFIVLIDIKTGNSQKVASGEDFYSSLAVSHDHSYVAWISWNQPDMPWDATSLWVAELNEQGFVKTQKIIANANESVVEPKWRYDNTLFFVSDRNNWWNIYRVDSKNLFDTDWNKNKLDVTNIYAAEMEFSYPVWIHGISCYSFIGDKIVATYTKDSFWFLVLLDSNSGYFTEVPIKGNYVSQVVTGKNFAAFIMGFADEYEEVVKLDLSSLKITTICKASEKELDKDFISKPQPLDFTSSNDRFAKANYYPPTNKNFVGLDGTLPPAIVEIHGGPTACSSPAFKAKRQFWTSRGFAVIDVNYGGSTGFGREYRELLNGNWGIVDVADCEHAAKHLVALGLVDENKLIIHGGSAGGYTALAALAFGDTFSCGASYYGVSDLIALTNDTHKFEASYVDKLVGPYPEKKDIYTKRSPINSAADITVPVIFFQGEEDKVVPKEQAIKMFELLQQKGLDTELVIFPEEGHGFRRAENVQELLSKELQFYLRTLYLT